MNRNEKFPHKLNLRDGLVEMTHGSGGRSMTQLIEQLFVRYFDNDLLSQGNDQASFDVASGRMVMSVDSHVVTPLIFPGGDIGSLAVHGTINDVAMAGARPLYLSAAFIIEEGFPLAKLESIVKSMAAASTKAKVPVITGDTKVVERGKGDGVFITTTGIGVVPNGVNISGELAKPGDSIIISGTIGDHGIAILSKRENLQFETTIRSDSAALHELVAAMVVAVDTKSIHCLRDPTRGGLAATLNEIGRQSGVGIRLKENKIPLASEVKAACELLGLDPLYIANEGKLVCICDSQDAQKLLEVMRSHPLGSRAAIIGEVVDDEYGFVRMQTEFGGSRVVDWLVGDQLPRIC